MKPTAQTIVLADGLFPTRPQLLSLLAQAVRVVCCDRAYLKYEAFLRNKVLPFPKDVCVVGDLDSLPPIIRHPSPTIVHIKEQDDNDLTKAVHFCFSQGWLGITILGATGLREDHTLGNISLLAEYLHEKPEATIQMLSDFGTFSVVTSSATFRAYQGQQVSIFSLVPEKRVWCQGLAYPIDGCPLTSWWQGTLNEALSATFTITVENGGTLIIFQTFQGKADELNSRTIEYC